MTEKPATIFIRKAKAPTGKLTLQVDSDKLDKVRKRFPDMNYSYVVEQILDHVEVRGLGRESILKLRLVRPEDKK